MNLTGMPFFSIIITAWNRSYLMKRALNSLLLQTEHDWEAIIVDDGSTDNTYSQVKPYLRSFRNIKYIRKFHTGEAPTKNAGIILSGGKFVTFLDSDDEYHPQHLQSRKEILLHNPEVKFLHGGVKIIGKQEVPDRFDSAKMIDLNKCAIGGTFFIDRVLLINSGGFRNILLGADADLLDRIAASNARMLESNIPTYIYHHENEDSITNLLLNEKQN
jgi:glycosyltransferase involved in cell wall biosynthesis